MRASTTPPPKTPYGAQNIRIALTLLSFVMTATACAPKTTTRHLRGPLAKTGSAKLSRCEVKRFGKASYYADKYHGRTTASGEVFDQNALTAAHLTLPFGTVIAVTRTDTGQSVRVRITDRGPFGNRGRVVDLSKRAARHLDMIRRGVVPVELEIIRCGQ